MNLKDLADRARELIGRRGGTESAREDAEEVRDIAGGPGQPHGQGEGGGGGAQGARCGREHSPAGRPCPLQELEAQAGRLMVPGAESG